MVERERKERALPEWARGCRCDGHAHQVAAAPAPAAPTRHSHSHSHSRQPTLSVWDEKTLTQRNRNLTPLSLSPTRTYEEVLQIMVERERKERALPEWARGGHQVVFANVHASPIYAYPCSCLDGSTSLEYHCFAGLFPFGPSFATRKMEYKKDDDSTLLTTCVVVSKDNEGENPNPSRHNLVYVMGMIDEEDEQVGDGMREQLMAPSIVPQESTSALDGVEVELTFEEEGGQNMNTQSKRIKRQLCQHGNSTKRMLQSAVSNLNLKRKANTHTKSYIASVIVNVV
jgi:hypothetical protein